MGTVLGVIAILLFFGSLAGNGSPGGLVMSLILGAIAYGINKSKKKKSNTSSASYRSSRRTSDPGPRLPNTCPSCGKQWNSCGLKIVEKFDNDRDLSGQIRFAVCTECGYEHKYDESFYYS